ncbi:hypothetical protein BH11BAC1_BH11BAC1_21600 [soil metagenome]
MDRKKATGVPTHGQLLYNLYLHVGGTQDNFAKSVKHKLSWFTWATKQEKLSAKALSEVNQMYKLPDEYWEGKYKLPSKHSAANEEEPLYKSKYQQLEEQFNKQKDLLLIQTKELADAYKKMAEMAEKINDNMVRNNQ